jgi:hypothetical protein
MKKGNRMKAKKKVVRGKNAGAGKRVSKVAASKVAQEDAPPPGVDGALHREIMRRINNRYYDTKDLCSMRRNGPGLAELAGVIPLTKGMGAEAMVAYVEHLEKVIATRDHCWRCEAKVLAIMFVMLGDIDPERARGYAEGILIRKTRMMGGKERNFFEEVRDAAEEEAKRIVERNSRLGIALPVWRK